MAFDPNTMQLRHVASSEHAICSTKHALSVSPSLSESAAMASTVSLVVAGASIASVVSSLVDLVTGESVISDENAAAECTNVVLALTRSRTRRNPVLMIVSADAEVFKRHQS